MTTALACTAFALSGGSSLGAADSPPYDYSVCGALIDRAHLTNRAWLKAGGMGKPSGTQHEMHEQGTIEEATAASRATRIGNNAGITRANPVEIAL